jgi:hypothetical protein
VLTKDKALAVGLELTLVGLIAYIPGKLLYQLMAGTGSHIVQPVCSFALKWRLDKCEN